ncbi:MAG TPA: CoA transferase, partial [Candidatus Dormibacteraeota bacterium]|nr:CoA transferase [Candidatus Dormibacteraeota bacterium]
MDHSEREPTAPLVGVRVLEIGNYIAGPFCGMQLADLGADVIKIESPEGGDIVRQTGPFKNGQSGTFARINRNKRSLAVDLKDQRA